MELYSYTYIFHFFAAIQFVIEDKHRQPISRYLGSFFLTQEHEPSVPQIGATKRNNLGQRHMGQLENVATAR